MQQTGNRCLTVGALLISVAALTTPASAQLSTTPQFFQVGPTATYLRTGDFDHPGSPTIISLGAAAAGELILRPTGSYSVAGPTQTGKFWAVFSSTNVLLLNNGVLNRVAGAIDIGAPLNANALTGPAFYGGLPMDIPQDFFIPDVGLSVSIPTGAAYLFVGIPDSYLSDNSTPNPATLGVYASVNAPEPATVMLLGCAMMLLLLARSRGVRRD